MMLFKGEYQNVIDILELENINEDSLSFSELNILGNAYYRIMNFQKAILHFYKAGQLQPENIPNLILLGTCYSSAGYDIDSRKTYEKILSIDPHNQTALVNLAKVIMDLEDYKGASKIYHKLIFADSSNSYFYSQLGICELKQGNLDIAKSNFERSLNLNGDNSKTILMLAKLYYNDKEYESALEILRNGLSRNASDRSLNRMLGDVFYKMDQFNESIIKYLNATTLGDTSANIYQKLGMAYYYLSFTSSYINTETRGLKLREGISALTKALELDKDDPINSLYLGLCFKELDEYETAISNFEETLDKVFPEYISTVYSNLGSSFDETGNYIESIITYKEALKYNPQQTIIYFYLANIYDRYYADKSVAVLYYQKFVDESLEADKNLVAYSLNRIKTLSQESKFWGK